jgi:O-acetyl-ADP-ribose deacetylase (regulator of RNase III)
MSSLKIPMVNFLYGSSALKSAPASALKYQPSNRINLRIGLIQADITRLDVDALVNAANTYLMGGGGVDGSIHRAAGPQLLEACGKIGGCPTGEARITPGFRLPARHVIHAVGPVYRARDKEKAQEMLRGCYLNSLKLADENKLKSIAFSCISTGVYGYPPKEAAHVACDTVRSYLEDEETGITKVVFCTYTQDDTDIYNETVP